MVKYTNRQLFGPPKKNQIFSRFNKSELVQKTVDQPEQITPRKFQLVQKAVEQPEQITPRKFQGLRSSVLNFYKCVFQQGIF